MPNRALYIRPQVTPYVLFLVARVGSTYLSTLMQAHPQIRAGGEELRDLEEQGATVQLNHARSLLTPPLIGRHKAVGFNTKLVHLCDPHGFSALLHERRCKIVHLQRRNRIKAVVSRLNGRRLHKETGMWGLFNESNRPGAFVADPQQFDEFLKHREKMDEMLEDYVNQLRLPVLRLYYEDMLVDEPAFLERLFSFLGVPPLSVTGDTLKITSDDLREVIVNFEEIRANYAGTDYEQMFDEVLI